MKTLQTDVTSHWKPLFFYVVQAIDNKHVIFNNYDDYDDDNNNNHKNNNDDDNDNSIF